MLRSGNRYLFDINLDLTLHHHKLTIFGARNKGNRRSRITGTTCTANSMHIRFRILRQRIIDHVSQVIDIDSTCGHIGSHQNGHLFIFKLFQDLFPLRLRNIAVQSFGRIASLGQPSHQLIHSHFCSAKDNSVKFSLYVNNSRQGIEFIAVSNFEIDLVRQVGSHLFARHFQHLDLLHVLLGQRHNTGRHGGRKEQNTTIIIRFCQNRLHILNKAHVEHLVRLIENQILQFFEIKRSATKMVENTSGSSYHNINPFFQTSQLLGDRCTAINGRNGQPTVFIERD